MPSELGILLLLLSRDFWVSPFFPPFHDSDAGLKGRLSLEAVCELFESGYGVEESLQHQSRLRSLATGGDT